MKKVTKFFMVVFLTGMCNFGYAQDYLNSPGANEKVLGVISLTTQEKPGGPNREWDPWKNEDLYALLLQKARTEYPNNTVDIREMKKDLHFRSENVYRGGEYKGKHHWYSYELEGSVVIPNIALQSNQSLSGALDRALYNVPVGSKIALDNISTSNYQYKDQLKDQIIDLLLGKGFRVVAKDYLQKLYKEQQDQQSGIYNERTVVQDHNFSAVGYFLNVKHTETSVRVQVVNVSTGEYEGNVTINY